ncbi:hypothetical protein MUO56_00375, partial [Candidatus Bathyarchaeota archaeon]|nr:hypothetical protein [Candidatus Bathyarchaeota archaeon]
SPSQRLSLRGRSPSLRAGGLSEPEAGAEPEPEAEQTDHPSTVRQAHGSGRTVSRRAQHERKKPIIKD